MATRLRALRQVRGETLAEVLERLGQVDGTVSKSLAYNVEGGKRRAPRNWREPWAAALGIEAGKLFEPSGLAIKI